MVLVDVIGNETRRLVNPTTPRFIASPSPTTARTFAVRSDKQRAERAGRTGTCFGKVLKADNAAFLAGRTDAGVHATGQVVRFATRKRDSGRKFVCLGAQSGCWQKSVRVRECARSGRTIFIRVFRRKVGFIVTAIEDAPIAQSAAANNRRPAFVTS